MDRAEILDGQLRAANVLIELIGAGLPAVSWAVREDLPLYGMLPYGLSDPEQYLSLAHWANVLGTPLHSESHVIQQWTGGSDPEHSNGDYVTRSWEDLSIDGVYHGVQVRFSTSVAPGTTKRTRVPNVGPVRSPDPVHTAQLRAVRALVHLLPAGLPPAGWTLRGHSQEPELSGSIGWKSGERLRADLTEWAGYLETPVRYDRRKRELGYHRWGEVTGHVLGVPIEIKADDARPPRSVTRSWQAFRSRLAWTNNAR